MAYNAAMGISSVAWDAWLRQGGIVVTASDRACRALMAAYHRMRRVEGLSAWTTPPIHDWQSFVRTQWQERARDSRLLLSPIQERSLWMRVLAESGQTAAILPPSQRRLADLAMQGHSLLASYAPESLPREARRHWQQDAAAFSGWLTAFDELCRSEELLSMCRLPWSLLPLLEADPTPRAPLLLVGFDRILPVQRALFSAWGTWSEIALNPDDTAVRSYAAADKSRELQACATWCKHQLQARPEARLLVMTQEISQRRGEIERAFLSSFGDQSSPSFEFSLGVPLGSISIGRSAQCLLRWLSSAIEEQELDWLIASGTTSANASETAALLSAMRSLRQRGLARTQWTLSSFLTVAPQLPVPWKQRITSAQQLLLDSAQIPASPLDWAALVPRVLQTAGWPGANGLSSAEFQALRRWQQLVEQCGSLGFDGARVDWNTFLSELMVNLQETLFSPESTDAPILIAGPAEAAGLSADAIWFLGADEDAWPARGSLHPLLPAEVQRATEMPHASAQLDAMLAQSISNRLLGSAAEICFSYARKNDGLEARPSRLIEPIAGPPLLLPDELKPSEQQGPLTTQVLDAFRIPVPMDANNREIRGGSTVLTAQSQCPFRAFAVARLGAQRLELAEAGLTASLRGQLLHAVLHTIWAGPPQGIRTLSELQSLPDQPAFVASHVRQAMKKELPAAVRDQMPARYIELEEMRLARLISSWLAYESAREAFEVAATELDTTAHVGRLSLKLRLDRIDRLKDGTLLVVDYKTADVTQRSWDLPRPEDVQLPLYAGFALNEQDTLGGLVFAKVRAGDLCFTGRVGDAAATLFSNLKGTSSLVKYPLTAEQLLAWRKAIEQLADDFLAGRADVAPREYPQTCLRCGLQTICRISERELLDDDDSELAEAAHE